MHTFADGSETAYGACTYLKFIYDDGNISTSLICSKSRITPLTRTVLRTIPRIELCSAKLAVELADKLSHELTYKISVRKFWSDSTTVLSYIRNDDKRFKRFVSNKVSFIRSSTKVQNWHYIPSEENPADLISRGLVVSALSQSALWLSGPPFLAEGGDYPAEPRQEVTLADEEVKETACRTCSVDDRTPLSILMHSKSNWYQLKVRIAWLLKLRDALYDKSSLRNAKVTVHDLNRAEISIIKFVQSKYYDNEISYIKLHGKIPQTYMRKLTPFLDDDNVLRVGGRLGNSSLEYGIQHPIILPSSSPIVALLAKSIHVLVGHLGRESTLATLRNKYWIVKGNSLVRKMIKNCLTCRKFQAKPMQQQMSELPNVRINGDEPAFTHVGLDYFGPFEITCSRKKVKRYGVIFTCLSSRAIHLEVAYSLDTDSFINALRRFMCRRGNVKSVVSDNGTNLKAGERELRESINSWNQTKLENWLKQRTIIWKFNPPSASHFGGVFEREIRSVRKILSTLFSQQIIRCNDEDFSTILCEIECILNDRPLTKLSDDPNDATVLTPNHILLFNSGVTFPPGVFKKDDCYLRRKWKQLQYLVDIFWSRWRKEYIVLLNNRQKWFDVKRSLKVNDIVLVTDVSLPRNFWPLGRITEIFPDRKGLVRSVSVRISKCKNSDTKDFSTSLLYRPVSKIILLPCN